MARSSNTKSNDAESKITVREPQPIWALIAILVVFLCWAANWAYGSTLDADDRGIFGDTFGAVNALFSGLAFAGVTYAILMQRYEVALAKEEASVTKKILDDQTSHLNMQNSREMSKSSEDTFFKLLSSFQEIVETVYFVKQRPGTGQDVFKGRHALSEIASSIYPLHYLATSREFSKYEEKVDEFLGAHASSFSHYLRSFETLLVYLTAAPSLDREFYAEIIIGQLSDAEQKIIFHCGLHQNYPRLKALIERYHLLWNIRPKSVIFEDLRSRYKESAFEFSSSHVDDILDIGRVTRNSSGREA